jgi:hypothetical protein
MSGVSEILDRIQKGEPAAAERLLPLIHDELRKLATAYVSREEKRCQDPFSGFSG